MKYVQKLTIKTSERRYWRRSGVIIVNFEHIPDLALMFLLSTLSRYMPAGKEARVVYEIWLKLIVAKLKKSKAR